MQSAALFRNGLKVCLYKAMEKDTKRTSVMRGQRFGQLTVLEMTGETEDRYRTWRCRCDCGGETVVNTKRLTRGSVRDCGCIPQTNHHNGNKPEDLSGQRFGRLVALHRLPSEKGRVRWLCRCDCGAEHVATAHDLRLHHVRSCGCYRVDSSRERITDISGQRFGRLLALSPTDRRDGKGSVIWSCRCDCGTDTEASQDALSWGRTRSCGCLKREMQGNIAESLTFADGTCLEWLSSRKHRSDNTSGHRGVYKNKNGTWRVAIGLQNKRYHIGNYKSFEEAVKARDIVEELLHDGFVGSYRFWSERADADPDWARENPFYFRVEKSNGEFSVSSPNGRRSVRLK